VKLYDQALTIQIKTKGDLFDLGESASCCIR
jgi:hypothetical protein